MNHSWLSKEGVTAIISLLSALGVAFIGYMSMKLQTEVENINGKIKHEELMLEIKRFEASQKKEKDELIKTFVPTLVNGDEKKKSEVLALLFVLYPNDAGDILSRIRSALNQEQSSKMSWVIEKAIEVNQDTGEWGIVIGADPTFEAAQHEIKRAKANNYSAKVYSKGSWFRTVIGPFPNKDDAERANIAVKRKLNDTAFVVNYIKWCGATEVNQDFVRCTDK